MIFILKNEKNIFFSLSTYLFISTHKSTKSIVQFRDYDNQIHTKSPFELIIEHTGKVGKQNKAKRNLRSKQSLSYSFRIKMSF